MRKSYFFQIAVKTLDSSQTGDVVIEGFASTPDIDRYKDIVEPSAFKNALGMYMQNPVLLYQHNADQPVGVVTSATITERGLSIRAEIKDADTAQKVKDGRMRALSIGYIPIVTELQHEDGTPFNFTTDSVWDEDIIRVIKELDLVEISVVSTPANGHALFSMAKSVKGFFNEFVTKNFMHKKENGVDVQDETPLEENQEKLDTSKVEGEEPEKPVEETKPEENTEVEAPKEEKPAVETAQDESKAVEGDETKEEAEKAGEDTAPDNAEAQKSEEANAEAKPPVESPKEEDTEMVVDSESAKALPELVQAGLLREAKDAGKCQAMPKNIVTLLRKLSDAYIEACKNAEELQTKLNATAEKKAFAYSEHSEEKQLVDTNKKTNSEWFKRAFNLK